MGLKTIVETDPNFAPEDSQFDCWGSETIVCPYCGKSFGEDSSEYFQGYPVTRMLECGACDHSFNCEPEYSVLYYSAKLVRK